MKNLFLRSIAGLFVIALFTTACNAQKYGKVKGNGNVVNKSRSVGAFDEIGVSGSFDVFLVKGNEGEIDIKIEENLLPYLVTKVENGELKIKWKKGTSIRTNRSIQITVHFKEINAVALSGSGNIVSKNQIKSDDFEIAVSGSGDIDLNIMTNTLQAAVSGSGDIELKGSSKDFTAAVSGSGDIDAMDLKTNKATLKISGSGGMTITVLDELIAKVSGSGDIKYKGNPKIEDIKVSGSGNVRTY